MRILHEYQPKEGHGDLGFRILGPRLPGFCWIERFLFWRGGGVKAQGLRTGFFLSTMEPYAGADILRPYMCIGPEQVTRGYRRG